MGNAATSTMRHPNGHNGNATTTTSNNHPSASMSTMNPKIKPYRHYSADWVLSDRGTYTQAGADPLLVASLQRTTSAQSDTDGDESVYVSDGEYDTDADIDMSNSTDDQDYITSVLAVDDYSRTETVKPPAHGAPSTRTRAKLARVASGRSINSGRSGGSGKDLAGLAVSPHVKRDRSTGITAVVGSGSGATMPLHVGDATVVLALERDDVGLADKAWKHRSFEPQSSDIEILIAFMSGVCAVMQQNAKRHRDNQQTSRLLLAAHECLLETKEYRDVDIHSLVASDQVLQAYMQAKYTLFHLSQDEVDSAAQLAPVKESALLYQSTLGNTRLAGTFGGQGFNWLTDFTYIYNTYPASHTFFTACLHAIQGQCNSIEAQSLGLYNHGVDALEWMITPSAKPSLQYLTKAPISYPFIAVTQLAQYYVTCLTLDIQPSDFNRHFAGGFTGHSQGVVSAVVAASSNTLDEFISHSVLAVKLMFWHGARVQQVCPLQTVPFKLLQESLSKTFGQPTPMMSIRGLQLATVQQHVDTINASHKPHQYVYVSLINAPDSCVVSGLPVSLHQLRLLLSSFQADPSVNQNRIPFKQRKLSFSCRYLPVSVPFHSPLIQSAIPMIVNDAQRLGLSLSAQHLHQPVWHTMDGSNLQQSSNLLTDLITMQCIQQVNWQYMCQERFVGTDASSKVLCTHVIDFGVGGVNGTGALTNMNVVGSGCAVIAMDSLRGNEELYGKAALYDSRDNHVPFAQNWRNTYAPKIVKRHSGSKLIKGDSDNKADSQLINNYTIESKFTNVYNKPIVMVPGMTPCTVGENFVSAIAHAGYHAELAGGGQHTEQIMRNRVDALTKLLPPGMGFTINLLFLNAYLWKFQFPLVVQLRKEGYPIDGITIGAGVPSPDMSDDILHQLRSVGIYNMGLKPGSIESIGAVRDIAIRNPASNIILQWTGGRAGGHHSCEDQHQPMLDTYASLRQVPNIVLVCGGGIGDAQSAMHYLSGEWSVAYGRQPMPFDAVMCGSRVMIAAECPSATDVKKLIASVQGAPDEMWEDSFDVTSEQGAGGVITILSELGEPIHKISNRGTRLWRHLDNTYFNLPRDKIDSAVKADRTKIVDSLNSDFQKPFFGQKADGTVVYDIRQMTYTEVANRMLQLMHCAALEDTTPGRTKEVGTPEWIDITYQMRFNDWLLRCCERFARQRTDKEFNIFNLLSSGIDPAEMVKAVAAAHEGLADQTISAEDSLYFLALSKRPGKPVNYVPIIDADLKFWLKKDSLWFAEDLRTVPGHDAQKVAILQGPVATQFANKVNEPVKDILDGINHGVMKQLYQRYEQHNILEKIEQQSMELYNASQLRALLEKYQISPQNYASRSNSQQLAAIYQQLASQPEQLIVALNIPDNETAHVSKTNWLQILAGLEAGWRRAMLLSPMIMRGSMWAENVLSNMLAPHPGQTVTLSASSNDKHAALHINKIRVYDSTLVNLGLAIATPALEIVYDDKTKQVDILLRHPRTQYVDSSTPNTRMPIAELRLTYTYVPSISASKYGVLCEQPWTQRCDNVLQFYKSLWLDDSNTDNKPTTHVLCGDEIRRFKAAIGDTQMQSDYSSDTVIAPIDYGIVVAWESICQSLMAGLSDKYGSADLLSLVHLSNEFIAAERVTPLKSADRCQVKSELRGVWDDVEGRVITVHGYISRQQADKSYALVQTIVSRFAIPPRAVQTSAQQKTNLFKTTTHEYKVQLTDVTKHVLLSKKWHNLTADKLNNVNSVVFNVSSVEKLASKQSGKEVRLDISTTGIITGNDTVIGDVNSNGAGVLKDVVVGFLTRFGESMSVPTPLPNTQYYPVETYNSVHTNTLYAITSKDVNPIHTNVYTVALASLPAPIVHGMHTSAKCRQLLSKFALGGSTVAYVPVVTRYKAQFMGMILPNMKVTAMTSLSAMYNGARVLQLELRDQYSGSLLMKATGYIEQPATAYLFTGQGSAVVGMGMQLYDKSEAGNTVRQVWDQADKYFISKYGFSILQIVRDNPKTLTVSLYGERGHAWRLNYQKLTVNKSASDGSKSNESQPLFPESHDTNNHQIVFKSVDGLLFQTQFQQPAILLTEKAFYEYMKANGCVGTNTIFAGHSLGEYGAVGCLLDTMSIASLAEVVFLRGLTMQSAVPRDSMNRSRYGMVAVSPIRVNPWFNEQALELLIQLLVAAHPHHALLQIVNYNTLGTQYVAAGHLTMLEALRVAIDDLIELSRKMMKSMFESQYGASGAEEKLKSAAKSGWPSDIPPLPLSEDEVKQLFNDIATKSVNKALETEKQAKDGFVALKRGTATIPLVGIDVPFHSKLLVDGVPTFRNILSNIFNNLRLAPQSLINRYIPNLLGIPFQLTHKFVQQVYDTSESPHVQTLLMEWNDNKAATDAAYREHVCKVLVVELLAYQFASPVQWIATQASLVDSGIRRFIEIGPSPVLTTMLKRGVAESLGKSGDGVELLWSGRDEDKINGADEAMAEQPTVQWDSEKDELAAEERQIKKEAKQQQQQSAAPAAVPAPAAAAPVKQELSAPAPAPASSGAPAESVPLSVLHSTKVIIGMKLKIPFNTIDNAKTVRGLAGGKSAIQNEILGDLSAEFKCEPEGADELPLTELANKLGSNAYSKPGKVLSAQISAMNSRCFPGAFGMSKGKEYLRSAYGVDDATVYGIQIHCLTMMPSARLSGEGDVTSWLDSVVQSYAQSNGVSLSKKSTGGSGASAGSSGGAAVAAIDPKEMLALKKMLAMQADLLRTYAQSGQKAGAVVEVDIDVIAKERMYIETIEGEYGSKYVEGIKPVFDPVKQRDYDSNWNWNRLHTVQLLTKLQRLIDSDDTTGAAKLAESMQTDIQTIGNRATKQVLDIVAAFNNHNQNSKQSVASTVLQFTKQLQQTVEANIQTDSVYIETSDVTLPNVTINERGDISMTEQKRYKQGGYKPFVADMIADQNNNNKFELKCALPVVTDDDKQLQDTVAKTFVDAFNELANSGLSFKGKTVLITGAGEGSIGAEVMRCMLAGGAWVIVTTSRPTTERWNYYRQLYKQYGGKHSKLTVLPYNAGSVQDTDKLIEYIFDSKGLGLTFLDYCLPFAAISEQGRDVTRIDAMSELAHRAMLINVHRLIGNVVTKLNSNGASNNNLQTLFVLPLSPNHGVFGGDGLYAESKIGLETLYARWRSEQWNNVVSLIGVEIGWTRGTGLMNANDIISSDMEKQTGMRTFDTCEMSFSIVGLLNGHITTLASRCPLQANYTGGFHKLSTGVIPSTQIRVDIQQKQLINKSIYTDYEQDVQHTGVPSYMLVKSAVKSAPAKTLQPRSQLKLSFPPLTQTKPAVQAELEGMLDLSSVVVCVGYGEVGPHGSSRTRWEYELNSQYSMEGAIELARAMQLIKFDPAMPSWVDSKDNKPVADADIAARYMPYISQHVGIREIEPALFDGYDPAQKLFLQQIAVEADMPPFEVSSAAEVDHLRARHGKNLEIINDGDRVMAKLKAGSNIYVPKNKQFDRSVASQLPTGWNATSYGIPTDLQNCDPVSLYALAATIDAFASAGISDPYEIYKYCHVSEVGNSAGGGMGGMASMKAIFRHRFMEQPNLASDLLQETFINTTPAWINMLLLSSSGPIKTPVSACATAAVSAEIAVDTIKTGKAKLMIAGGFEDFGEEGSYEFAQMNATSNSINEYAKGRPASEHSRPATTTRAGFMESQGAGIQILCTAELAIQMGLPVYAIIAGTATATDRQGRSIPAPGRGILTTARESKVHSLQREKMLDLSYRRKQLISELKYLDHVHQQNVEELGGQADTVEMAAVTAEHRRRVRLAQQTWSHSFNLDNDQIAPLRAHLAVYGLTVNDLEAVSFHGTSTKANDKNESAVVQHQMMHLGRDKGKPLYTIFQKWLTGHPKGAAAAWMLNGIIQSMQAGIVPGNKNLDNTSAELEANTLLLYTDSNIELGRQMKAAYLHSFGFGQAGAQVIVVNPAYLFSAIDQPAYASYYARRQKRETAANQHWCEYMLGEHTLVPISVRAPYADDDAMATYLNPLARAVYSNKDKHYVVDPRAVPAEQKTTTPLTNRGMQSPASAGKSASNKQLEQTLKQQSQTASVQPSTGVAGLGIDVEDINDFSSKSDDFIQRNYTAGEINYCQQESSNKSASLAGMWCGKESVIKALTSYADAHHVSGVQWKTAGAPLSDIEIRHSSAGAPHVVLSGHAKQYAEQCHVSDSSIVLSISHTATQAIAQCIIKQ